MPGPDWHFVVATTKGVTQGELNTAVSRQITWNLADSCTAAFTMDAMEADANYVQEVTSDLMCYRDNHLMFRGRFMSSQDTIGQQAGNVSGGTSPDVHTVDFTAVDYRGMLAHRMIPYPTKFYGKAPEPPVDQCSIAWDFIERSMDLPGGDWGIHKGLYTPALPNSPQMRRQEPAEGTYIDQAIDNIATLNSGFEWEISPTMAFNTWPQPPHGLNQQGRGQNIGMKLTYGDNVTNVQRAMNASTGQPYANVVRMSGTTGKTTSKTKNVIDEALDTGWATSPLLKAAGRWEFQAGNGNLTSTEAVNDAAIYELVRDSNLTPSYVLTLKQGWWDPSDLWLGDIVTVTVNHGRLNDSILTRVTQMDIFIGDTSSEEVVQVTVGPKYTNLLHRILQHEKVITRITKNAT
jgi:hypothetical protein